MHEFTITPMENGHYRVTYNLATLYITEDEALAAATDQAAADELLRRLRALRERNPR